ncbi:MAG: hypothetical protein KA715_09490 [Xanthomonadaceae bacterium]|nr:hypothetical protein [Xanthomonadaceae bacterium]
MEYPSENLENIKSAALLSTRSQMESLYVSSEARDFSLLLARKLGWKNCTQLGLAHQISPRTVRNIFQNKKEGEVQTGLKILGDERILGLLPKNGIRSV